MKVQDVMTKDAAFCAEGESLAAIAEMMRRRDCGAIPVTNDEHRVVGIVTDRDICLAAANRQAKMTSLRAADLANGKVVSCEADESVKDALKKMGKNQIKRLPVTSKDGHLVGIIAFADIVAAAEKDKSLRKNVYSALKKISKPSPITLREIR